jgi:hypothetical protein
LGIRDIIATGSNPAGSKLSFLYSQPLIASGVGEDASRV